MSERLNSKGIMLSSAKAEEAIDFGAVPSLFGTLQTPSAQRIVIDEAATVRLKAMS